MDAKPTRLRKKATQEEILASLPVQARVRPARWVFLWVLLVACTALFIWVIFRPPEDVSAGFGVWRGLSFIALPLCLVLLPAATMSLFRPRQVTFDETRVWTRDWSVDWADVKSVGGAGAQAEHTFQLCLFVGKKLWNEGGSAEGQPVGLGAAPPGRWPHEPAALRADAGGSGALGGHADGGLRRVEEAEPSGGEPAVTRPGRRHRRRSSVSTSACRVWGNMSNTCTRATR